MSTFLFPVKTSVPDTWSVWKWVKMTAFSGLAPLASGVVVTIEPGLYFIPTLLKGLQAGPHGKQVDWKKVEHLARFGGVRIEDEVHCTEGTPENLTRDAFAELAG